MTWVPPSAAGADTAGGDPTPGQHPLAQPADAGAPAPLSDAAAAAAPAADPAPRQQTPLQTGLRRPCSP
eukprot:423728-Alexandrium_andersonii.AAC.1